MDVRVVGAMKTDNIALMLIIVGIVVLIGACERARWNECRRVHPFWYCFDQNASRK